MTNNKLTKEEYTELTKDIETTISTIRYVLSQEQWYPIATRKILVEYCKHKETEIPSELVYAEPSADDFCETANISVVDITSKLNVDELRALETELIRYKKAEEAKEAKIKAKKEKKEKKKGIVIPLEFESVRISWDGTTCLLHLLVEGEWMEYSYANARKDTYWRDKINLIRDYLVKEDEEFIEIPKEELDEFIHKLKLEKVPEAIKPPFPLLKKRKLPPKYKGRAKFPMGTGEFIRAFLHAHEPDGAYPYQVWAMFRKILQGIITYPDVVIDEILKRKERGIEIDGMFINGKLTKRIEETRKLDVKFKPAAYHIPRYDSFWNFFMVLNKLELIHKTKREKSIYWNDVLVDRQYYVLAKTPKKANGKSYSKTELNEIWRQPQKFYYPMKLLGSKKWNTLKEEAEYLRSRIEEGEEPLSLLTSYYKIDVRDILTELGVIRLSIEDVKLPLCFIITNQRELKHIAKVRGLSKKELEKKIFEGKY